MSDVILDKNGTPRTDAIYGVSAETWGVDYYRMAALARQLERELAQCSEAHSALAAMVPGGVGMEGGHLSAVGPHEPTMVYDPNQGKMVRPGGERALVAYLRQLFDKTAEAHGEGDYADKVNAALVAVYAYGRRQGVAISAIGPKETGWLIENGQNGIGAMGLRYRTIEDGIPVWTADVNKAIRFARRADAELFCAEDDQAWRIAEHQWG